MHSLHFIGEWFGCRIAMDALHDPAAIRALCVESVMRHHLPIVADAFIASGHAGVIGTILADDLHIVLRTFPEQRAVDVGLHAWTYQGAGIAKVFHLLCDLCDDFRPTRTVLHRVPRAVPGRPAGRQPLRPTRSSGFPSGRAA